MVARTLSSTRRCSRLQDRAHIVRNSSTTDWRQGGPGKRGASRPEGGRHPAGVHEGVRSYRDQRRRRRHRSRRDPPQGVQKGLLSADEAASQDPIATSSTYLLRGSPPSTRSATSLAVASGWTSSNQHREHGGSADVHTVSPGHDGQGQDPAHVGDHPAPRHGSGDRYAIPQVSLVELLRLDGDLHHRGSSASSMSAGLPPSWSACCRWCSSIRVRRHGVRRPAVGVVGTCGGDQHRRGSRPPTVSSGSSSTQINDTPRSSSSRSANSSSTRARSPVRRSWATAGCVDPRGMGIANHVGASRRAPVGHRARRRIGRCADDRDRRMLLSVSATAGSAAARSRRPARGVQQPRHRVSSTNRWFSTGERSCISRCRHTARHPHDRTT